VKLRRDYFASAINKLKVSDVVGSPYFYYIYALTAPKTFNILITQKTLKALKAPKAL
jgi:hypothetical protein